MLFLVTGEGIVVGTVISLDTLWRCEGEASSTSKARLAGAKTAVVSQTEDSCVRWYTYVHARLGTGVAKAPGMLHNGASLRMWTGNMYCTKQARLNGAVRTLPYSRRVAILPSILISSALQHNSFVL